MFFNTMHGKYCNKIGFLMLKIFTNRNGGLRMYCQNKNIANWEFTRHRKKPVGGGRLLTNVPDLYQFNAWYISVAT